MISPIQALQALLMLLLKLRKIIDKFGLKRLLS